MKNKIFIKEQYENLSINAKIKLKEENGIPLKYLLEKGYVFVELEEELHFTDDIEFIADAIDTASVDEVKFFAKRTFCFSDSTEIEWIEEDEEEMNDTEWYYSMAFLPSSGVWCYAPHFGDAMALLKERKEDEDLKDQILRSLR